MNVELFFNFVRGIVPLSFAKRIRPAYHFMLAFLAALVYGFPSRKLTVIGITGTNGKTSVVHITSDVLEAVGFTVASASSLRFKIGHHEWPNMLKQTMPGRFFLQRFLRQAVRAGAQYVILEVTSEGIRQSRHRFIAWHTAVLTNVTPEHIESHGGFMKYRAEKAKLFRFASVHILNSKDREYDFFNVIPAKRKFTYDGSGDFREANKRCVLAIVKAHDIDPTVVERVVNEFRGVPGRLEYIKNEKNISIVVDYAHTPDALEKVYKILRGTGRMLCVLGAAGGGRDKWKRPEFGRIASTYCEEIILTDEDPYDENPATILQEVKSGISEEKLKVTKEILDRKEAIAYAIKNAQAGDTAVITGKGSEKLMAVAGGEKIPWDDREVVRDVLRVL